MYASIYLLGPNWIPHCVAVTGLNYQISWSDVILRMLKLSFNFHDFFSIN